MTPLQKLLADIGAEFARFMNVKRFVPEQKRESDNPLTWLMSNRKL